MARASSGKYRKFFRIFILLMIISAAGSLVGLPLYLRIRGKPMSAADSRCRPCACDCPPRPRVPSHIGKLIKDLYADCGGDDPAAREEMQKDFNALLKEQLELTKAIAEESLRRNEALIKSVRNSTGPYRREADKCRASVLTCEEAREKAEAEYILERKRTAEWERRAREKGWIDPSKVYI